MRRTPLDLAGENPRRKPSYWVTMWVALIVAVVNLPFIGAVLASFKTDAQITSEPLRIPAPPTLEHYDNAVYAAGYDFPQFFRNSTLIAIGTVILVLAIATPASFAIVRLGLGRRWLLNGVAGLRLLPAIFFVIPMFVMFSRLGLLDSVYGMMVVDTFLNLPIAMVLLCSGIADIPASYAEAAVVDGASPYRILTAIYVPLLGPTLVAASVVTFFFTWNDFLFAVILTTTNARTVTVGATNFVTSFGIRWGDISAVTVLSAMIPILFAVFARRYLVSGLTLGGLKG
jgi:multiple sugar transport system permease protein